MMVDMSNFDPLFLTAATSQLLDYQGTHTIQKYRLFFASHIYVYIYMYVYIYAYIHIYIYKYNYIHRYAPSNFLHLKNWADLRRRLSQLYPFHRFKQLLQKSATVSKMTVNSFFSLWGEG